MMGTKTKEFSPRKEVIKQKRQVRYNNLKNSAVKLSCGLLVIAFAIKGSADFISSYLRADVSKAVPAIIAAIIVSVLALKLASCESNNDSGK